MNIKIKIVRKKSNIFKPETNFLRLNNFKSKKFLNWHPQWSLDQSLKKILEWHKLIKIMNPKKVCEDQIHDFIKNIK